MCGFTLLAVVADPVTCCELRVWRPRMQYRGENEKETLNGDEDHSSVAHGDNRYRGYRVLELSR
jgi:hypothetical protein